MAHQTKQAGRSGRLRSLYTALGFGRQASEGGTPSWFHRLAVRLRLRQTTICPRCQHDVTIFPLYNKFRVCPACRYHFPIGARARVNSLVDPHSYSPLIRTRESVLAGTAHIANNPIVLITFDFAFQAGTLSVESGEIVARAFEHAATQHIPVVAVISSGGVRIQQGMPALLQMAKTTQAVQDFRTSHQPFIAVLANPTTGGVYASFSNLADVLLAEPGALIGFAGPRVAQAVTGEELPSDSHRAESALENGMIDGIIARDELRDTIASVVALTSVNVKGPTARADYIAKREIPAQALAADLMPAQVLALARHSDRPTARDYAAHLFTDWIELRGDRATGDDPKVLAGLGRFEGQPVVVIAQMRDRHVERERGASATGYRKAERMVLLAERFGLPIITLVDTPGADPGYESEKLGIAGAIAHMLAALLQAQVPTVSIIIGEGMSGGAIAFAVTDRVLMQENAIYTVISPEGASAIVFGDSSRWVQAAEKAKMTANDLLPLGIVDCTIPEPKEGAHADVQAAANAIRLELRSTMAELLAMSSSERLASRHQRYRQV